MIWAVADDDTIPTDTAASLAQLAAALRPVVVDWGVATSAGRVRASNEDAWGHDGCRFAVADGMGGHAGGDLASRTAVQALLADRDESRSWHDRLAIVNEQVRHSCEEAGFLAAGTTLVAVDVRSHGMTVVSVGDSRVYRWRPDGVEVVTVEHTLASDLQASGIDVDLHRRRGVRVEGLTSYLGVDPARLLVDVTEVELLRGDRVALVTDGVWAQVGPTRVADLMAGGSAQSAADGLVAAADDAGGLDNATALVVEFGVTPEGGGR